jgi:hypothetical protein
MRHMRSRRSLISLAFALGAALPAVAAAQSSGDPMAGGFTAGDYLRIGGGVTAPINPQGSLNDWKGGPGASLIWESWSGSPTGLGRAGFGIGVGYSLLPLDEQHFIHNFTPLTGGTTTSASASRAGILEVTTSLRIRIPAPLLMPAINVGFGFINWHPGKITYVATSGTATVRQQSRSGAMLSLGGSLERHLWDRYGAYVEGNYIYGYTTYGRGFATPGSVCSTSCDPLKNTTVTTFRAGLRIRVADQ